MRLPDSFCTPEMADGMSSAKTLTKKTLHKRLRDLIVQACEAGDVDLIYRAIIFVSAERVTKLAFPRVFSRNATKVLV
jgi:hypothetical protein